MDHAEHRQESGDYKDLHSHRLESDTRFLETFSRFSSLSLQHLQDYKRDQNIILK